MTEKHAPGDQKENKKRDEIIPLIKQVAKRVSDKQNIIISEGIPRTDGNSIFLPFQDSNLNYLDLEALAAHEGAHIRFLSVIDPALPNKICKYNPILGHYVLNLCEDSRVDLLCLLFVHKD